MKGFKKFLLVAVIALIAATSFTACSACGEKTTKYELSFATNGGDAIASVSVEEGASYTLPTPVREGYEFDGWYLNADFTGNLSNAYDAAILVQGTGSFAIDPVSNFDSGYKENASGAMRNAFHEWFGIRISDTLLYTSPANQVYMPTASGENEL